MRKYLHATYLVLRRMREFLFNFVAQFFYFPIKFIILFFVWNAIYGNMREVLAYSVDELIGYYFILTIVETVMMPCGIVAYEEWHDINHGDVSLFLAKPISYILYHYMQKLGEFLIELAVGLFFIYTTKFILGYGFGIHFLLIHLPWFLVSLFLGFSIMLSLFQIVGHITFWVENILSLRDHLWNVIRIFSGEIFPIVMYPLLLQKFCKVLPFQYIYYLPISILQGKIREQEIFSCIMIEFVWCLILAVLNILVWKRGVHRYAAQGG